ncbi:MAG TPA: ATP-binding cassette domain-containing protein [Gryllotalpicola sp.]
MGESLVSIRDFRMDFGRTTVIESLSFDIREGETFGFLGSNGWGKTTTIRALLGIYEPTAGTLHINGRPFTPQRSGRLGYLPEERGLYKKESVIDTMTYFGKLKGLSAEAARSWSREYLARVELADKEKVRLDKLSGVDGVPPAVSFAHPLSDRPMRLPAGGISGARGASAGPRSDERELGLKAGAHLRVHAPSPTLVSIQRARGESNTVIALLTVAPHKSRLVSDLADGRTRHGSRGELPPDHQVIGSERHRDPAGSRYEQECQDHACDADGDKRDLDGHGQPSENPASEHGHAEESDEQRPQSAHHGRARERLQRHR